MAVNFKINIEAVDKVTKHVEKIQKTLDSIKVKDVDFKINDTKIIKTAAEFDKVTKEAEKTTKAITKGAVENKEYAESLSKVEKTVEKVTKKQTKLGRATSALKTKFSKLDGVFSRFKEKSSGDYFKDGAMRAAGVTAAILPVKNLLGAYQELRKAQGEVASLGVDEKGLQMLSKEAINVSNQYGGIKTQDFVRAAFDIKSGIASLNDTDLTRYTKYASITAEATRSTSIEMSKLFALGYGVFRKQFKSDADFVNQFSAGIAEAARRYRTDGADLTRGVAQIGASASAMGVSLQEELGVIGSLKDSFNTAAEAATGYRAFLVGTIKAQKNLGVSFSDANGKLLPTADIIDKISNAAKQMGVDVSDANFQGLLLKGFGSTEAVKVIDGLIGKTGDLRNGIAGLNAKMKQGPKGIEKMAKAMQRGKEFDILSHQIKNASIGIAKNLMPVVIKFLNVLAKALKIVSDFSEAFPVLSKTIIIGVAALVAFQGILAVTSIALGTFKGAMLLVTGVIKTAQLVMAGFNLVMSLNPIGAIVLAVAALVLGLYELWKHFDAVKKMAMEVWDSIKKTWGSIGNFFSAENTQGMAVSAEKKITRSSITDINTTSTADGKIDINVKTEGAPAVVKATTKKQNGVALNVATNSI